MLNTSQDSRIILWNRLSVPYGCNLTCDLLLVLPNLYTKLLNHYGRLGRAIMAEDVSLSLRKFVDGRYA